MTTNGTVVLNSNGINGKAKKSKIVLGSQNEDCRKEMSLFWKGHSANANEEEMMLDSSAQELGQHEIPEILAMLPDVTGLDVLELGAGIGRFTGHLAVRCKSIIAVDFMESFIKKNEELNGHHSNASFMQADVMHLDLPAESVDLVFSNWLLMYLEEPEVLQLFNNILYWLKPGGYFFFRESCFHKSGNSARDFNPTKYRDPGKYNDLLEAAALSCESEDEEVKQLTNGDGNIKNLCNGNKNGEQNGLKNGGQNGLKNGGQEIKAEDHVTSSSTESFIFEIIMCKSVQTYIKLKSNRNQLCWLLNKAKRRSVHGWRSFQEFLDQQQYKRSNIIAYEWIFGKDFISPGGLETAQKFSEMLHLQEGESVLDLGCGIGGSAFYMAQEYRVNVTGMDLSSNMISRALERANEIKDIRVQFEIGDATKRNFPDLSFDAIYSRDTILHIQNKDALFAACLKWLKPGGRLLVTDYCCRPEPRAEWSDQFREYVDQRSYHLLSVPQYAKLLLDVGFKAVSAVDRSDMFEVILQREINKLISTKHEFLKVCREEDYEHLLQSWQDKLVQCQSGDHRYASFLAEKL